MAGADEPTIVPSANVMAIHVERLRRSCAVWPSSGISAKYGVQYTVRKR